MPSNLSDKPTYEEYVQWYYDQLGDDLESGRAEMWYERVTDAGAQEMETSGFWKALRESLRAWNTSFQLDHSGYSLFETARQPRRIHKKAFESVINKSFRWNVLENTNWPRPPQKSPSTASKSEERDAHDPQWWYGPQNWLADFPDIFRTRLTTNYFDGVRYLAQRVEEIAEQTTVVPPRLRLRASLEGHHAAHLWIYHELDTHDYDNGDPVSVSARLEIQITTTIQATIGEMLHRVYEDWRVHGPPPNWEWDEHNPAFSVNYLGSTLHFLEGMIVVARDRVGSG